MYCLLVAGDPNKLYSKVKKKGIKTKSTGTRFTRSESESESESTGTHIDKVITLYTNILYNSKILYNFCRPSCVAQSVTSGNRCESDCRSRGREFDPGPVPYFRGDGS